MPTDDSLTVGINIRSLRKAQDLTLAELAARAGLSVSYVNMLEKNRRIASDRAIDCLAQALGVRADQLTKSADDELSDRLVAVVREHASHTTLLEPASLQEFLAQQRAWAECLVSLSDRLERADARHDQMMDRLILDPRLEALVHEVLTHIAANRAAAEILESSDAMKPQDHQRFLDIVQEESRALSRLATSLMTFLDEAHERPAHNDAELTAGNDPQSRGYYHDALETYLLSRSKTADIDLILADFANHHGSTGEGSTEQTAALRDYAALARALPYDAFHKLAKSCSYDLQQLAATTGQDLVTVAKRLVTLRKPGKQAPDFALFVVDATGHVLLNWHNLGLTFPRSGHACPLWVIHQAQSQPGIPMVQRAELPDGARYLFTALTEITPVPDMLHRQIRRTLMLACHERDASALVYDRYAATGAHRAEAVGISCRFCPRTTCPVRR